MEKISKILLINMKETFNKMKYLKNLMLIIALKILRAISQYLLALIINILMILKELTRP
jgi:hypothetical protein